MRRVLLLACTYFNQLNKSVLICLGVLACLSFNSGYAQFSGAFAPFHWTFTTGLTPPSDGYVDTLSAPASIELGSDDDNSGGTFEFVNYSIVMPACGTISFDWSFVQNDASNTEEFYYSVDANPVLGVSTTSTGSETNISVSAGQVFAFSVFGYTDDGGRGIVTISNFSFTPDNTPPAAMSTISFTSTGPFNIDPNSNFYALPTVGLPDPIAMGMLSSVCLDITFPTMEDLDVAVVDPAQSSGIYLNASFAGTGVFVSGSDFTNTCFDRISTNSPLVDLPPYTNTYDDNWTGLNDFDALVGLSSAGDWYLYLENYGGNTGTVNSFTFTFAYPITEYPDTFGNCAITFTAAKTLQDNCDGSITGVPSILGVDQSIPFTVNDQGTTTVVWTFEDSNGNTTILNQDVILADPFSPTITCSGNVTVNADPGLCSATVVLTPPSTSDNCTVDTLYKNHPSNIYPVGTTPVLWTVEDEFGNTDTCTQFVTVTDNQVPSITCPGDVSVAPDSLCFATGVALGSPTTGDNCLVASVTNNHPSATYGLGSTPVIWTVTDVNGLTNTCTQTVTVSGGCGNTAPVAFCKDTTVSANGNCLGTAPASSFNNGSFDPDGDPLIFSVLPAGPYPLGPTSVVLTVSDGTLSSTCSATITVVDLTPPSSVTSTTFTSTGPFNIDPLSNFYPVSTSGLPDPITPGLLTSVCLDITFPTLEDLDIAVADPGVNAGIFLNNPSSGPGFFVSGSDFTNTCFDRISILSPLSDVPPYTNTYDDNWTGLNDFDALVGFSSAGDWVLYIENTGGNTGTVNSISYTFEFPQTDYPQINASCSHTFNTAPTLNDNCDGPISGVPSIGGIDQTIPLTIANQGSTFIVWTFTDVAGNSTTINQTVVISDFTPPTITCPGDINVNAGAGQCTAVVASLGTPTTADNCGVLSVTNNHPSTTYPVGNTVVRWIVEDINGNTDTCFQNVTVTDTEIPTITCSPLTVNADPGLCQATINLSLPVVSDNCGTNAPTNDHPSTTYLVGTTPVVWTVTDVNGLTNTCTQNVTVTDNQAPSITCASDVTVNADPGVCTATVILTAPTTGDNCGVASTTNNHPSTTFTGITSVIWTVTDVNGLTSTCTQMVTVTDNQAPSITCAPDVTVNADPGVCTATVILTAPTTGDNCGVASTTNNHPSTTFTGITSVIWTVTDVNGLTSTCTQMVTVTDNQAPSITCASDVTVNTDPGVCTATVILTAPTTGDNCGVASTTNNHPSTTFTGITSVIWTVTDVNGLTSTCTQNVTVTDNQAPSITCASDVTVNADPGVCTATVILTAPTTGDNCGVASTTNNHPSTTFTGITSVIWTVTDVNGLTSTCTQMVTVTDNQAPSITCAPDVTVNADPGVCTATVILTAPTTGDNCGVASTTNNHPSTTFTGITSVIWTVTDVNGLTSTCTQMVTVTDNQVPSITCPSNVSASTDSLCFATGVVLGTPTTGDNCGVASTTNNHPSATYALGVTPVIWTVTDINGLTSTCTQTVTVTGSCGNNAPVAFCKDTTVVANGSCLGTAPATAFNNGSFDPDGDPLIFSVLPAGPYSIGTTPVVLTVSDGTLSSTCSANITVVDVTVPSITCASDVTVNADPGVCTATVILTAPTTGDNCGVASTTNNHPSTTFTGITSVIWTVTDVNGLTNTCTQMVTVTDNQAPSITCASDVTVNADPGVCTTTVILTAPTTGDNCGVASTVNNYPSTTYSTGTTPVIWTVTDVNGLTNTCTQNVTVTDNQAPSITCASDVTVNADPGVCTAIVILTAPTTGDNCGVASTTNNHPSTTFTGITSVIWTVTDVNGLTSTCTQMVTVTDNQAPSITCASDVTVNTDPGVCTATVILTAPTTGDNCGVASTVSNHPSTTYSTGTTPVVWTVTDVNGLTNTCTQNVTVTDNEIPTITCASNVSANTDPGVCTATVILTAPTTGDNCGVASTTNNHPSTTYPTGTTPVIWTVTDVNGFTNTCTQNVTVTDNQAPSITCASDVTVNADPGVCTTTVILTAPTTGDNCGVASTTNNHPSTTFTGITAVIWTVTDVNGLTSTCTQMVTVTDNQVPSITCPSDISSAPNSGCNATGVVLGTPVTSDNCSVASVVNDHPSTTYPLGATPVIWTVTDVNGLTNTCTQTVTISGPCSSNNAPVAFCKDTTVSANGNCLGTAPASSFNNASFDPDGDPLIFSVLPAGPYPLGPTSVVLTVSDGTLSSTCSATITVVDLTPPSSVTSATFTSTGPFNIDPLSNFYPVSTSGLPDPITPGLLTSVCLDITFPTLEDLDIAVADPGVNAGIFLNNPSSGPGFFVSGSDFTNTCFDRISILSPLSDVPPYTNTYDDNWTGLNDFDALVGFPSAGDWFLYIENPGANTGTVNSISYTFTFPQTDYPQINASCSHTFNTAPTLNDNCDGPISGVPSIGGIDQTIPLTITNQGSTFIVWTFTDVAGNSTTINQTVVLSDNTPPTIVCAADVTVNNDPGVCTATVTLTAPTTGDNCGVLSVTNNHPSTTYPVGNTVVRWIVEDINGNTDTCFQNVTVTDTEIPTITCSPLTVNADPGLCEATINLSLPAVSDNCGTNTPTNDHPSTTYLVGTTPVVWTVTDVNGLTNTCTQNVTVTDNQAPSITCASDVTVNADPGVCTATVILTAPTTGDNCGVASTTNNHPSTTYPTGTTPVIWTVTDVNGLTNTCTQNVTVTDNEAPTIVCAADVSVNNDPGLCSATVILTAPTTGDNCGVASTVNDHPSTTYPTGTTPVIWTVTDINGLTNTCTQNVTVTDNEAPTIVCAADVSVNNDPGLCSATVILTAPTTGDNCGVASTVNNHPSTTYPTGTTPVIWTVTDVNGLTNTCTQNVTVTDNEAPTIICAADVTVNNDPGLCSATVILTAPTTGDNCGVASAVSNHPSTTYPTGTTPVIWTVTDINGLTNTCTQNVTVTDNEAPTIVCAADVTVNADPGVCSATVILTAPTTGDNCGVASTINNHPSTTFTGVTSVIWTVTDINGLTNTCTHVVTVTDNQVPGITCPSDVAVAPDAGCNATGVVLGTPVTSDNCAVSTVTNDHPSTTYAFGVTPVIWTVTDINGLTNTCTQTVTVSGPCVGNTAPVAMCKDTTVIADAFCMGNAPATAFNNGSFDPEGDPLTFSVLPAGPYSIGTTPVVLTVSDGVLSSTCSANITVVDVTVPTIVCAADVTVNNDPGVCTAIVILTAPTTGDNCGVASTVSNHPSTTYPTGTTPVIWTVTDVNGLTNTCTQNVTVTDNEAPTIVCAADVTVNNDPGLCSATVILTAPTTGDNCGVASTVNDHPSTTYPTGTTPVIWTVTDVNGLTNTCTQNVTVTDNEAPTIVCAADVSVNNDPGLCSATVILTAPTTGDNCGVASTVNNHPSTTYPTGTTPVIWTVTDINGLTNTCTQNITVTDNEAPTIVCAADVSVNNDPGVCTATVILTAPTTGDNCGVASTTNNHPSTTYASGTTPVIWTVTDVNGLTNTCTQNVTVTDNEAPTIICAADVTVNNDPGLCSATVILTAPTTGDNCGVASTVSNHPSTTYPSGTTPVIWTVTDINGLTNTCTQNVTVTDNEAPTIVCAADVSVNNDPGLCSATVILTAPTTGDNCGVASTVNNHPSTTYPTGTTPVIWTVTDVNGLTNTCTQNVTVTDNEAPTIVCASDVTVNNDPGVCSATVILTGPTTGDNCGVASTVNNHPSTTYPTGTTPVIWTVTDINGLTNTCTQNVTVTDNEAPTIICAADVTVNNDPGLCSATVILTAPTTGDNCGVASTVNNHPSTTYPAGTTPVIWTVTDVNGLTNTCTQNVTVTDNEVPTITCAADTSVNTDPGLCSATVILTAPTTGDNCGVASTVNNHPSTTYPTGTTPVIWTVTDVNGLTNTCTQNVTVTDNEAPIITCPANVTDSTDAGVCTSSTVTLGTATTSDNCGVSTVSNDAPTTFPIGTTIVTWTVTDINGNSSTCAQSVTVVDIVPPVAVCQSLVVYLDSTGTATITGSDIDGGSTDNCGIASLTPNPSTFDCNDLGANTVILTVTDFSGNTATCSVVIDVLDTLNPVVIPPASVVVNADPGSCYATGVNIGNPTIIDNCAIEYIINDGLGLYPVGTTTVTWTVQDFSGNTTVVTQTVTVIDNQNPTTVCNNITVYLDASGNASITPADVDNGSSDNCGIATMTLDISNFNCSDPLTVPVVLTVTDVNGNTSSCTSIVTVLDTIAPTITAPGTVTVNSDPGSCFATGVALGSPIVNDNCASVTITNNAPSSFPAGNTTVIWTATDADGNTSTATQTVTVIDNQNPVITGMPANITTNNIFGACFATATWSSPSATDNCGVTSFTSNYASGSVFSVGVTNVIYTAMDAAGNITTDTFTVTVIDAQAPTILGMPGNITQNTDPGLCSAVVNWTPPSAFDNCSALTFTSNFPPGSTFPVGVTTVIYTATDASGNTATASFTVTVVDNTSPSVSVVSPLSINADPGMCSVSNSALPAPTVSDNCGVASVVNNSSSPMPVGTHNIIWTVTDVNGNTTTVSQTVIVVDNQNPTLTPPADIVTTANSGGCSATGVSLGIPTFGDNCGVASVSNNALSSYPAGVTNVIWMVTDINGNTTTAIQTVTVNPVPVTVGVTAVPAGPVCEGTMVTLSGTGASSYTWSGGISNGIPFAAVTTTTYTVTGTGTFGCTGTATYTLTVNPLPTVSYTVSPNDSVCANSSITLNGTGASSYVWTGGVTDGVSFNIAASSTYTVTGTDAVGCSNTAVASIWVSPATLSYTAFPNDTVCEGTQITLNGIGGSGYTWTAGISDGVPFTPAFSETTILSGTDAFGCPSNIAVDIVVNYNPVVDLGPDIITGASFVALDAGNSGSSYLWNDNSLLTMQTIFVNSNGTYYVAVTDANGCVGSDTVNVAFSFAGLGNIDDIEISLYPNPNNGIFTLSLSQAPRANTEIRLVDELGQVLYTNQLQSQTQSFDFSYLRAATYYIQVISSEYSITKTIIITHKY